MPVAVLTRDPGDVAAYAAALAPLGLEVLAMPVTKAVPPEDPDALARALDTGDYAAILVASARAANELARAVASLASVHTTLPDLPDVWAVGPATKAALDKARLPAHQPANARDGVELANALAVAMDLRGKRVLVPRAEEGRSEPLEILRAAGADVVDVIAYRTVALAADDPALAAGADLLVRGGAAICAVFAPSQVAALAAALEARDHELAAVVTQFCAIGETTAAALRAAGIRDVAVAVAPTPDGMAQAVASVYPSR
ncbi:MAG TPA: uroporphyrinogen-III synthase [Kofleriaceae bacterium]